MPKTRVVHALSARPTIIKEFRAATGARAEDRVLKAHNVARSTVYAWIKAERRARGVADARKLTGNARKLARKNKGIPAFAEPKVEDPFTGRVFVLPKGTRPTPFAKPRPDIDGNGKTWTRASVSFDTAFEVDQAVESLKIAIERVVRRKMLSEVIRLQEPEPRPEAERTGRTGRPSQPDDALNGQTEPAGNA